MEIWKDIIGFKGIYQISNQGRVRSLEREQENSKGNIVHYKGKILKQVPNSSGYLRVELKTKNKSERWFVHRLVAFHFVNNPAPDIYTVVNHLDCNYLNNSADNLEWTTLCGNSQHALLNGRTTRTKEWLQHLREANEANGTAIIGKKLDTNETVCFICLNDCKNNGFQPSCVCKCCKGNQKTHKGYEWRYATQEEIKWIKSLRG